MPKFSQQHYVAIAALLSDIRPPIQDETVAQAFLEGRDEQFSITLSLLCDMFVADNPAFKRDKFEEAIMKMGTDPKRRHRY